MGNRIIVVRDRRTPWNGRNCCHKPQCRGFNYEYNNNDNIFVDDDGHSRETTQTYAGCKSGVDYAAAADGFKDLSILDNVIVVVAIVLVYTREHGSATCNDNDGP